MDDDEQVASVRDKLMQVSIIIIILKLTPVHDVYALLYVGPAKYTMKT